MSSLTWPSSGAYAVLTVENIRHGLVDLPGPTIKDGARSTTLRRHV